MVFYLTQTLAHIITDLRLFLVYRFDVLVVF